MKLVVTSDVHVHPHRVGSADGGRDRLADGLSALEQTLALAEELGEPWLFLGDLKMPKAVWPQEALNGVRALLRRYAERGVAMFMLPGNHDGVDGAFGTGLEPFRDFARVLDRPAVADLGGARVAAWPWGARRLEELDALLDRATRDRGPLILAAHATLAGAAMGTADHAAGRGVPLADLRLGDGVDVALVGDVHKGQAFLPSSRTWKPWTDYASRAAGKGRQSSRAPRSVQFGLPGAIPLRQPGPWRGEALYPGSPYQQGWGEAGEWPKGALLVDVSTGAVDLVPVLAPRFRAVEVASLAALEALAAGRDCETWAGDVVRLFAPAAELARKPARAAVDALRARSGARALDAIPRRAESAPARTELHGGMTPEQLVAAYAKARPLEGVDADLVERAGAALLIERDEGDDRVA